DLTPDPYSHTGTALDSYQFTGMCIHVNVSSEGLGATVCSLSLVTFLSFMKHFLSHHMPPSPQGLKMPITFTNAHTCYTQHTDTNTDTHTHAPHSKHNTPIHTN